MAPSQRYQDFRHIFFYKFQNFLETPWASIIKTCLIKFLSTRPSKNSLGFDILWVSSFVHKQTLRCYPWKYVIYSEPAEFVSQQYNGADKMFPAFIQAAPCGRNLDVVFYCWLRRWAEDLVPLYAGLACHQISQSTLYNAVLFTVSCQKQKRGEKLESTDSKARRPEKQI